jgi:hypothetical protein
MDKIQKKNNTRILIAFWDLQTLLPKSNWKIVVTEAE